MIVKNPTKISWTDPTTFEDGSPFGASDFKAYELGVSPTSGVQPTAALLSLPTKLGVGTSPIPDALKATKGAKQYVSLRTLDNYGQMSEWSNQVEVIFTGRPFAPSSVSSE